MIASDMVAFFDRQDSIPLCIDAIVFLFLFYFNCCIKIALICVVWYDVFLQMHIGQPAYSPHVTPAILVVIAFFILFTHSLCVDV